MWKYLAQWKNLKAFLRRYWRLLVAAAVLVIATSALVTLVVVMRKEPPKDTISVTTHETPKKDKPVEQPAPPPPVVQTPAPAPPPPPPPLTPSRFLGLTNWKLTLPVETAHAGTPDEIMQPELTSFSLSPYFQLTAAKNGVIFQAPAGGATTKNSDYPRSELREMTSGGKSLASWSNTSGTHVMTVRQAITHLPVAKPEVVSAQIHDGSDDVVMVRLDGTLLHVEADGEDLGTLEAAYSLGTPYTLRIEASGGRIKVFYNNELKVDYERNGSGWYFKAGCYTQSNPSKGDSPNAYGEVVIFSIGVSHT